MPPIERATLHQKAVLWPASGYDQYGEPTVGEPEEIDVQWTEISMLADRPDEAEISLDAQVTTDVRIEPGSLLWLGTLAEWEATGTSFPDQGIHVVKTQQFSPDVKGREIIYKLGLQRHRNA